MAPSARRGYWLFVLLLALFAAAKAVLFDTIDPDCFWHLKVADHLCRQGIGPVVDDLSFASMRTPWTPYSWLAELGMKAVWDLGGFRAAILVQAIVQAAIVLMLGLVCVTTRSDQDEAPDGHPGLRYGPAALAVAAGVFLFLPYLSFRPVTFGFLILLTITWLLARGGRAIWWVVPLTTLYANVHLFVFFVPVMVALSTRDGAQRLGSTELAEVRRGFFDREASSETKTRRRSRSAPLVWFIWATCLASLATPMLPGLLRSVWNYTAHDQMVTGPVIAEMRSIVHSIPNLLVVLFMLGCCGLGWKRLPTGRLILIGLTAILTFKLGRFVPLFVIVTAPAVAMTLRGVSDRVLARPAIAMAMSLVITVIAFKTGIGFPGRHVSFAGWVNRHGVDTPGYPCAAADYVADSIPRRSGRIVNEFSWGGYLEWRLGPADRILLDGRTQVFPPALWRSTYLGTENDRAKYLSTIDADAAVLPSRGSLFRDSLMKSGWTPAYRDDRAEVLIPPAMPAVTPPIAAAN